MPDLNWSICTLHNKWLWAGEQSKLDWGWRYGEHSQTSLTVTCAWHVKVWDTLHCVFHDWRHGVERNASLRIPERASSWRHHENHPEPHFGLSGLKVGIKKTECPQKHVPPCGKILWNTKSFFTFFSFSFFLEEEFPESVGCNGDCRLYLERFSVAVSSGLRVKRSLRVWCGVGVLHILSAALLARLHLNYSHSYSLVIQRAWKPVHSTFETWQIKVKLKS